MGDGTVYAAATGLACSHEPSGGEATLDGGPVAQQLY